MDLIPSNKQTKALLKVSQGEFATAIKTGRYLEASKLMPRTIAKAIEEPKVFELIQAIGENCVLDQIEFELVNLNLLMSVGGKLNDQMVSFIASGLLDLYPYESIADFKLCFERGAMGRYGPIQRLDGITITEWMGKYLDEKYIELEKIHKKVAKDNDEQILTDNEKINGYLELMKEAFKQGPAIAPITEQEIKDEGQERPKKKEYIPPDQKYIRLMALKGEYGRDHCDLHTGRTLPGHPTWEEFLELMS